jgi:hypothetical protein
LAHEAFLIEERGDDRPAVFLRDSFVLIAVAIILIVPISRLATIRELLYYNAYSRIRR